MQKQLRDARVALVGDIAKASLNIEVNAKDRDCLRFLWYLERKSFNAPATAALPDFRVSKAPPFSTTGVDFAGPLFVKAEGGVGTDLTLNVVFGKDGLVEAKDKKDLKVKLTEAMGKLSQLEGEIVKVKVNACERRHDS
eukprot:gene15943-biopygen5330